MKLTKIVKEILKLKDVNEKELRIDDLGDMLEFGVYEKKDLIDSVNLMLNFSASETNLKIKESVFHAINNALVFQNIGEFINWENFIKELDKLNGELLDYGISFLGFSRNEEFLPIIKEYLEHDNKEIRETAQEAIEEILYSKKES